MIAHDPAVVAALAGFALLLALLAAARHYAPRTLLPAESWVLLAGLGYGLLLRVEPRLPMLELSPSLVILTLLPVLVFSGAETLKPREVARAGPPIALLAGPGVVLTLLLIGLPLHYAFRLPLHDALLLAAAVAATDPSAVTAIFARFQVPERLNVLLEGESLFNDGTAIVAFLTVAALVFGGAQFSLGGSLLELGWTLAGAALLGTVCGAAGAALVVGWREKNRFAGISLSLATVYGTFLLAEALLHVSGAIAVIAAAWAFVWVRERAAAGDGVGAAAGGDFFARFWDYLGHLAGGLVFFALGAAVGEHDFPWSWAIPGVVLLLLMSRALLVYGCGALLWRSRWRLPLAWQHVQLLGGLRGAVSAALVLMLPEDYRYRELMLCVVLLLCLYTLLVHPALIQVYLRRRPLR